MNEFYIATSLGLETLCKAELAGFSGSPRIVKGGLILVTDRDISGQLVSLVHSAHYVVKVLSTSTNPQKLTDRLSLPPGKSFMVRTHPRNYELERLIGANIKLKVNLKEPDIVLRCFNIGKGFLLGIDPAKQRLSTRAFRVFMTRHSLNPVSAFALGFSNTVTRDAFLITSDGLPMIESVLHKLRVPIARAEPHTGEITQEPNAVGVGLSDIVLRGARQNSLLAGAPLKLLGGDWKSQLLGLKQVDRLIASLNFVRNSEGMSALQIYEAVARIGLRILSRGGELRVLVLAEKSTAFKNIATRTGITKPKELSFMQGKLRLSLLSSVVSSQSLAGG